jgi:hypothetical protein
MPPSRAGSRPPFRQSGPVRAEPPGPASWTKPHDSRLRPQPLCVILVRQFRYPANGRRTGRLLGMEVDVRVAAHNSRVPCHPTLEEYLNAWIGAAGISRDKKGPLFRTMSRGDQLGDRPMSRFDVLHVIKRRAEVAALLYSTCCHTFRATGITHVPAERRNVGARPDCQPRIATHDETL